MGDGLGAMVGVGDDVALGMGDGVDVGDGLAIGVAEGAGVVLGLGEGFGVGDGFTARALDAAPKMKQKRQANRTGRRALFFDGVFTIIKKMTAVVGCETPNSTNTLVLRKLIRRGTNQRFASPRPVRPMADTANPSFGGSELRGGKQRLARGA